MACLTAVVVFLASPAAPAFAADPPGVSGTIYQPGGKVPAAGAAVTMAALVVDRHGVHTKKVGNTTTDQSGHYRIPYPAATTVANLAKLNGGIVNWEIDVGAPGARASVVIPGTRPAAGTQASIGTTAAKPTDVTLTAAPGRAGTANSATPMFLCTGPIWVTISSENRDAIIGEPHSGDGDTVQYTYLEHSMTTIDVAVKAEGSNWTLEGSSSESNESTSSFSTGKLGPDWAKYVMGTFIFYLQTSLPGDPCGVWQRWLPGPWTGGVRYGADTTQFDKGTAFEDNLANTAFFPAGSTFSRTTGRGAKYKTSVDLGGVKVGVETDFSADVTYTWNFDQGTGWNLFGHGAPPTLARIIYSANHPSVG